MGSSSIDYHWMDDVGDGSDGEFRWTLDGLGDLAPSPGMEIDGAYEYAGYLDQTCFSKRSKIESCSGSKSKAYCEKKRRDRLNERFLELSVVLKPGRPPKSDKGTILADAARTLVQLRTKAEELKEVNEKLRKTIKDLKDEKNELRDEKLKLKVDKERLEQQINIMSLPPAGFIPHPSAYHSAATMASSSQRHGSTTKSPLFAGYLGSPAWQWLPPGQWLSPASRDIAQDPKNVSPTA